MGRINLNPDRLRAELDRLSSQLVKGIDTLDRLPEVDVGQTPHQVIYREDQLQLNYYPADDSAKQRTGARTGTNSSDKSPLLIVYALVNRPYILDLQPDRSLIRALTERGQPVYLIDWGYPGAADCYLDLDDYINGYIDNCVDQVCAHSGSEQVNLLGVCQGGVFSLCYSALNPQRVARLVTLVTPVDFDTDNNLLGHLAKQIDLTLAQQVGGNIDGDLLTQLYKALMPARLGVLKQLSMPGQLGDPQQAMNFLRMERWINDSPDLAASACREFVDNFYHHNRFINGELNIGGSAVELTNYRGPLLNIYAAKDHLVPPASSKALATLTGSQSYQEQELSGGHIGVFVGRHAQSTLPELLANWLNG